MRMLEELITRPLIDFSDYSLAQGPIHVLNRNAQGAQFFPLWIKLSEFTIRFYNDQMHCTTLPREPLL